jgi:hypothetical protein
MEFSIQDSLALFKCSEAATLKQRSHQRSGGYDLLQDVGNVAFPASSWARYQFDFTNWRQSTNVV